MEEVYGQTVFVDLVADAEKKKINADNRYFSLSYGIPKILLRNKSDRQ